MSDIDIRNTHLKDWEREVLGLFLGLIADLEARNRLLRQIEMINKVDRPPRTYREINFYRVKWFTIRPAWDQAICHHKTEVLACKVCGVANANAQVTVTIWIVKGLLFSMEWHNEDVNTVHEFSVTSISLGEDLMATCPGNG